MGCLAWKKSFVASSRTGAGKRPPADIPMAQKTHPNHHNLALKPGFSKPDGTG
jgi:hypothetical protein